MMIHPSAIIDKSAKLGKDVSIGPYCIVGPHVVLGDKVTLKSHVVIEGRVSIGKNTTVFPFASIGQIPQDLKYRGEDSWIEIGENNSIREHVTIHPGTNLGNKVTKIGNNCLLMVGVHIAHDCVIGNHVILANNATLAGHVVIENHAIIGGLCAIHQFTRIGAHSIIGGMSGVEKDVLPYALVKGERAKCHGVNIIGLKRYGFSNKDITEIAEVFGSLFKSSTAELRRIYKDNKSILKVLDFVDSGGQRPIYSIEAKSSQKLSRR